MGTDLNAACSGLAEVRPKDGPNIEGSQHPCSLKYDGYIKARFQYRPLADNNRAGSRQSG
ncbi:hypothetical protein DVQ84_19340 [Yersinia enterocolitica]|nr:hypothetical protein [Yersinia enterocolitica]EKN6033189.1 hypothetical protein [Yersinia enterocolitica]EKN6071762.1 hypothetical protein [Yersinia enterocolitica]EKN6184646.1 hypothetical protein [Yersinia enterocolitica]EKN6188269.1 hypothetical protein [Yersinia enterocolitica]